MSHVCWVPVLIPYYFTMWFQNALTTRLFTSQVDQLTADHWGECALPFTQATMVRTYQRKSERQSWDQDNMVKAIHAVKSKQMGAKAASNAFGVPRTTLRDRLKNKNAIVTDSQNGFIGGFQRVFSAEQEDELCDYILKMEELLMGLTIEDVRYVAFQLAEKNSLSHPFNKENKLAGADWYYNFIHRHPLLSLRTPEATSAARARGFNRTNVKSFYDLLDQLMTKYNFGPGQIYNTDETAITTVQGNTPLIIGRRGKKQIGCLTSAERGTLVTAMICNNAAGNYVPPMLIFPRVRWKAELLDGAPPSSIHGCHKSGWMTIDLFTQWFQHFLQATSPTAEKPVLLVLDGHSTHTKNIQVIDLARANNVHILCLPPHCTHKLQPLDVTFMKPLNMNYDEAVRIWLREHPGRTVSIYQIAEIFGKAYLKAAKALTAVSGLDKTGIFPFNPNLFEDADFAGAEPTDQPVVDAYEQAHGVDAGDDMTTTRPADVATPGPSHMESICVRHPQDQDTATPTEDAITADCSTPLPVRSTTTNEHAVPSGQRVRPADIIPIPHVTATGIRKKSGRRAGATAILTSSPYQANLLSIMKNTPVPKVKTTGPSLSSKKPSQATQKAGKPQRKKARQTSPENNSSSESSSESEVSELGISSDSDPVSSDSDVNDFDEAKKGDYVLVKFAKKQRATYYCGQILDIDEDEAQTQFLRRCDLHKGGQTHFRWPENDDCSWHKVEDIVFKFPKPVKVGGTNRTSEKLTFGLSLAYFDSCLQ